MGPLYSRVVKNFLYQKSYSSRRKRDESSHRNKRKQYGKANNFASEASG